MHIVHKHTCGQNTHIHKINESNQIKIIKKRAEGVESREDVYLKSQGLGFGNRIWETCGGQRPGDQNSPSWVQKRADISAE